MDHGDQTCVYTWGFEVNAGHKGPEIAPRVLETFDGARVLLVKCSSNASLALTANGKVWWWGWMGGLIHAPTPVLVEGIFQSLFISFIAITTPGIHEKKEHCACISDKNDLYMWGSNINRQISSSNSDFILSPIFITNNIKDVACGDSHTIAVQMNGDVVCWGSVYKQNEVILMGKKVRKVSAGAYGFCGALSEDNTLYTWAYSHGVSEGDFLGHGVRSWNMVPIPTPVASLSNNVKYFECGWIHAGAVTLDGDLYTWGEGDTNRLGHGTIGVGYNKERHKHVPTLVKGMEGTNIFRLSLSRGNEGAVTENGDVYTWGGNDHGGHHLHPVPTLLPLESSFFQGASIQALACGLRHTVIVLRMQRSLQYLCLRAIVKHFDKLLDKICLLPEEMREAVGSFMNDRRQLTAEKAQAISISLIPFPPPLPPPPAPTHYYGFEYEDDSDDELDDGEDEDEGEGEGEIEDDEIEIEVEVEVEVEVGEGEAQ